jgi:sugar-specific transcriptional regulator TrmB
MANNSTPLVACLTDLGMSEREARVYLALLNKRYATATELQKLSGVPQSKVYEIIDNLVRHGYCLERKVGRKRTFEIIDPKITLTQSFASLQKKLKDSFKQKKKLEGLFAASEQITEPLEYIEILRGNETIHRRYCQLVRGTNEELLGFGRGPYACDTNERSAEQDREEEEVLDRGGVMRWVYELKIPDDEWLYPTLDTLQRKGAEIRVAQHLPIKMMIFDRQHLLVAEEEPSIISPELTMSIVKQRTIVKAFIALFEFFWQNSLELEKWKQKVGVNNLKAAEY